MRRTLRTAPAAAAVVIAMVGLAPQALASEPTASPSVSAATSSPSTSAAGHPSGHEHESATDGGAVARIPGSASTQAQPGPTPAENHQSSASGEGVHNNHGAEQQTPATVEGAPAEGGHTDAQHGDSALPVDRPRGVVLGGFGLFNTAVLLYAARLRRRTAPDHLRRRAARAASLTTDISTTTKEAR